MNSSLWILFFTMLMGAPCKPDNGKCPSFDKRYLPVPAKIEINNDTMCGKLYANSSCCSEATIESIESRKRSVFNVRRFILSYPSEECDTASMQLACLFECSPDFGRLQDISRPLKDVPICKSSCERLFNACKLEVTCTDDWGFGEDFDCVDKENLPPFTRDDFLNKFKTAEHFCSKVRGAGVAKMATSDEGCFNLETGQYVEEKQNETGSMSYFIFAYLGLTVIAIGICLAMFYVVTYALKKHRISRGI